MCLLKLFFLRFDELGLVVGDIRVISQLDVLPEMFHVGSRFNNLLMFVFVEKFAED